MDFYVRPLPNATNTRVLLALYIARRFADADVGRLSQRDMIDTFLELPGTRHIANPRQSISRGMSWLNKHGYIKKSWGPSTAKITVDGISIVHLVWPSSIYPIEERTNAT